MEDDMSIENILQAIDSIVMSDFSIDGIPFTFTTDPDFYLNGVMVPPSLFGLDFPFHDSHETPKNVPVSCKFYDVLVQQVMTCDICMEEQNAKWIKCNQCEKCICMECFTNMKKMSCPYCRHSFKKTLTHREHFINLFAE